MAITDSSFFSLGLTTSPLSIPAEIHTNHLLPQALAPLSLRLPTRGSTSPLELTLEDLLAIRQVFVARMGCGFLPTSSPPLVYTQWRHSLTALEYSPDLLP